MKLKKVKKFLSLFLVLCMLIGNLNVMNVSATGTDDNYQTTTETEESKDDEAADVPADTPAADTPAEDIPAEDTPVADTPAAEEPAADAPAVVASEDPADTEGWVDVYLDDENIEYDDAWTIEMKAAEGGIDSAFCYDQGAKATLTFYGTGIRWYGQKDMNFGEAIVRIDGQEVATVNTYGSAETSVLHYGNTSLTEGTHTISIEPKNQGVQDVSGCIDIEKFEVLNSSAKIPVSEIEMSIDKATIYAGNTAKITATFKPFNATNKELTYTSSDAEVATVDANGLVTGLKAGTVTITGTVSGSDATDSVALTVKEQGAKAPLRMTIDEDNPLFLHHLYLNKNQVANNLPGPLEGGKSIQGFWDALVNGDENGNQLPEAVRDRQVLIIHAGGNVRGTSDTLAWYEARFEETKKDNIPFVIMVSNSGTGHANSDYLPPATDWVAEMYDTYPNMMGVIFSENHNARDGREARSEYMNEMVLLAREYGGYVFYSDMNDNDDYVETVLDDQTLFDTLKANKDNFVLLAKTTSAWSNVSYNSHESVAMGAWMADIAGNWGSLIDSWMWFIEGFGPLYGNETFSVIGGAEECRGPVTFPELLFEMRMIQQARAGATVFTFEHPDYSTGIGENSGADTYFTPAFTEAIVKAMEYMTEYEIPGKDQVLAATKVAYAAKNGTLNDLAGAGVNLLNPLYGDTNHNGYNNTTMMTYSTGRYGTVPSLPELATAEDEAQFDEVLTKDEVVSMGSAGIKPYFDALYPQNYTGTGYAHYLNNTWYAYNSNWNIDSRVAAELHEDQYVDLALENNNTSANITFNPYTTVLVDDQTEGKLRFKFNNYLVDKNEIWEGYNSSTQHWDSDNNQLMYNWIMNEYIPDAETEDDTYRQATIVLDNLTAEPTLTVVKELTNADGSKQAKAPETTWDAKAGTYTIELDGNGWMTFDVALNGTGDGGQEEPEKIITYLSDIPWIEQSCGGGFETTKDSTVVENGNVLKLTLKVDGNVQTFDKGLGIHAPSSVTYNVKNRGYLYFETYAGVDYSKLEDYTNTNGNEGVIANFIVEIDGEKVAESGEMNPSKDAHCFKVEIPKGAETITLITETGANDWSDWGDWADAKFAGVPVEPVPAEGVEITAKRISYAEGTTIKEGRKAYLTASPLPADATDEIVSWTSADESIATVEFDGEECTVTGVKAGSVEITATATSGAAGTITINVLEKKEAAPLRRVVDRDHILYLENYYWSDDFANKNGVAGNVPQEERVDSPVMLWNTVPDSLKENTVILLIAERSLNNTDAIKQWIKDNVELCNANNIPCAVQNVNGETRMDNPIPIEFWEELAQNNPYLVGFNGAELYNRFNGDAREYMVDLIQMGVENGIHMMWTDTNTFDCESGNGTGSGVLVDWLEYCPDLANVMRENKEYISLMYKESYGNPSTEALYLGMWLTDYIGNWGIASDWWHWQLDSNGALFDAGSGGDAWKQCLTWPEAMYTMDILRAASQGATCFKSEAQWYSNATKGMRTPGYQYSIAPFLEKLASGEYRIPTQEEVLADTKAIVVGRNNWNAFNYDGTYSQLYPSTDKYGIVPFVPSTCPTDVLNEKFEHVFNAPISKAQMDEIYTDDVTGGTAYCENYGDTYYFLNSSEDKNVTQNAAFEPATAGVNSVDITATPHTYGVITAEENKMTFSLGNYRIDKSEIWTDSKYAGGFSDMACYSYVWELCERMGVLSDPTDDTNHDTELRETVIEVVCDSKPAAVFAEANEYTRPYEYTENWNADTKTYTLTVKHNGIVDVELISNTEKVTELEITQIGETITALNVGETLKLYAEVNEGATTGVVWTSSNEDVATVTNGKVYAKAAGTVTITAEADGVKDTITLTVSEVAVESITLSKSELTIMEGKTESISAEVKPDNATNKTVVWTSSNKAVAKAASNGNITAVKPGKATITAESANGIKANVLVTVEADPNPSKQITSGITATATSAYAGTSEGPASNVLDGKRDTIWHSNYGSSRNDTTDMLPISITLDLGKEYDVNKVEYVPRSGASNGTVTKYNLYIDDEKVVSEGIWEENEDVKAVEFKEPVKASEVTLEVLEGKGGFASAAEIRVYQLAGISSEIAPDTAALAAKVNEAAALDLTKYEDGAAKEVFKSALTAAQAQAANPTDQFAVDEALEALAAAKEALVLKENIGGSGSDNTGSESTGSGSTGSESTGSGSGSSSSDETESSKPQTGTAAVAPATQSGTTITLKPSTIKPTETAKTETTQTPAQDETDASAEDKTVDTKIVDEAASEEVVEIVKEAVAVEEGKATVNAETVEKVLEATEEGAAVILPLTKAKDGQDVTTAEIPVEAIEKIEEGGAALTIEFADAKVILYPETLKALKEQAEGKTIEIRVVQIEHHELLPKQQEALDGHEVVARVSAQIFCDGKYIGDFMGGKAIIAIPFVPQDGTDGEDYAVYYVAEDGTKEKKPSTCKEGYMLVETGHFSDYVIVYEGAENTEESVEDVTVNNEAVENAEEAEEKAIPVLPIVLSMIVIAAAAVVFFKKKKQNQKE